MQIHQVLVAASPHDAAGELAFDLQLLFSQIGTSEIFARYYEPHLTSKVKCLDDLRSKLGNPEDILIYHATIGDDLIVDLLDKRPEKIAIIYHNITPSRFFYPFNPNFAKSLDLGREQVRYLAPRVCGVLAGSNYNAQELLDFGYKNIAVVPPLISLEKLLHARDEPIANHLKIVSQNSPIVVYVGQLLPHKRPDFLIQAFDILVTNIVPQAQLIMVGTGRLPKYKEALHELVSELNLGNIWLTGQVSLAELAEFYRSADIIAIPSEHEGFCLPLIKAMAFEKPILARDYAAISETLGSSGVVMPKDSTTTEFAEAMAILLEDRALRNTIVKGQNLRLKEFSLEKARVSLLKWLMGLI